MEIPPGLPTFLVTCDDGLLTQYTQGLQAVDNIERQTGYFVPLTLFTMTRFEGLPITEDLPDETPSFNDDRHRYMNKGQLLDMLRRGHYLQNHTADHMSVTQLSGDRLSDQIEVSEGKIDALWELAERERTVRAFAYPNGRFVGRQALLNFARNQALLTAKQEFIHSEATTFRATWFWSAIIKASPLSQLILFSWLTLSIDFDSIISAVWKQAVINRPL